MPDFSPIIRDAYEEILGRRGDPGGVRNYDRLMNQGMREAEMRESLIRSDEYAIKNPDRGLPFRIGLNVHIPTNRMLDDIGNDLGMQWIRVDFDWFRIEPQQGAHRWADTDRVIQRATALGLEIMATLAYTPDWASASSNPRISDPPASTSFWTDIVRRVVARYGDRVRYWQLWNEPNLNEFWGGSMSQYRTQILEAGARVAKDVRPGSLVVAPGLANLGEWRQWFEETMKAKNSIDVINHHNYQSSGGEAIMSLQRDTLFQKSLRTLISDFGVDGKPFWITETGRRTQDNNQSQLLYYQDFLSTLRRENWVDRVFFFHYWDGPGQGNGGFGIVNENFSPKPVYNFLQSVLNPSALARASRKNIKFG